MKTLYMINKVLIIINVILGLTIYFGLLFMIITGFAQVVMFIVYLSKWKKISDQYKTHFITYGCLTIITLIALFISVQLNHHADTIILLSLFMGGGLAFYFLYLSKKQYEFYNTNLKTDELLNS